MNQGNHLFYGSQPHNMQPLNIFRQLTLPIFIAIITSMLIGCNSGSGSGESQIGASSALIEGVFVDSPVTGLNYTTNTQSGLTDAEGKFYCYKDEMIQFSIGDVVLGETLASDIITPMDFLNKSQQPYNLTHPMITNMGRFLQSLDADGDPDNGIIITDEVRNEVTGRMIVFNQSIEDFENDPDVVACFAVFNGLNMPHNNMMWGLTSANDAQQHMITYMGKNMPGYMNGHMNLGNTNVDYNTDTSMNENMGGSMNEPMNDQMDFADNDGDDVIDYPINNHMGENMHEPTDDQVGFVNNVGNTSGNSTIENSPALIEGVFVDSPVEGLDYFTETHVGITDVEGRFVCFEGEMITFMIGDVVLGQCLASDIITPMDFLNEPQQPYDITHPIVTNMCRFLQSLDSDGDPDNGITISPEVREEMIGRMIDFNQSIEGFENDPYVLACFDMFNGLNMPHNNMMWCLTSAEDAQRHMTTYMGGHMPGYMNGHMNNYMNLEDSNGDDVVDYPTNGYMEEYMPGYMNNRMDNGMGMCW
jgi:hypothetical protein